MMRRFASWLLAALLASSASAAAPASPTPSAAPPALVDDRGAPIVLAAPPRRIVSLLPSLTESVCALGACASLVGTDRYSNWPDSVKALPKLGGLDDVQVEAVVALRPDLVLASTSTRVVDRLESLGLEVVVLESRNHADIERTLHLLARLLDLPGADERVSNEMARATRTAALRVPDALRGRRVYFELDATPYAAGAGSFLGETLQSLGMPNAIPADLGPFPKLNPEYVVRIQPDIIMASRDDLARMPRRPGWDALRALERDQTCGFSPAQAELLTRPGPRMGEGAGILADCLVEIARGRRR